MTPGKDTSEYKLSVRTIAALVVAVLGCVAASGLLPPEHLVLRIISGVLAIAGTLGIGQVTTAYTKGRSQIKSLAHAPPLPEGGEDK